MPNLAHATVCDTISMGSKTMLTRQGKQIIINNNFLTLILEIINILFWDHFAYSLLDLALILFHGNTGFDQLQKREVKHRKMF